MFTSDIFVHCTAVGSADLRVASQDPATFCLPIHIVNGQAVGLQGPGGPCSG